ncbi:autotransporter outer membrane beta-barrel domain-containing protein [Ochrobactrum soli]|uniref:Autotransporter outer membrane beta-barrel domain-containing protein n=1 Tax=Ochrobactrum soli TaxID=2448455 RepID=A0A849KIW0_9HYPH|nr:autotransporter outer membrane beta-barrel domain-containing protein [[Ochrobactrum] soli]NNU59400.1 autotransporter outer membrane beta-barrel domain-containing protein [[Ochrobactrum] soli]
MRSSRRLVRLLAATIYLFPSYSNAQQAEPSGAFTSDAEYLASWGLPMINPIPAYRRGFTGKGITVAVLDTGIDIYHPEFAGKVHPWSRNFGTFMHERDVRDLQRNGTPIGHGTHVSGTIAAARNGTGMHGVAYDAQILALRAIVPDRQYDAINRALRYASTTGVKVLNGSYGPYAFPTPYNNRNYQRLSYQPILYGNYLRNDYEALKVAAKADIVMVFAAGNNYKVQPYSSAQPSGSALFPAITPQNTALGKYKFVDGRRRDLDMNNPNTFRLLAPNDPAVANLDFSDLRGSIIAVVSVGPNRQIASYSNRCGIAAEWCMAAPGGDTGGAVYSTYPGGGYSYMQGTSMATPHVAGAAAVVRQAFPYMNARQTIETLLTTATNIGPTEIYGQGLLNLGAAINGPMKFRHAEGFDVDTQGYSSTWSNPISGIGGLTKRGAGILRLTGDNSFTGDSAVVGGTLIFDGDNYTSVRVARAGRLSGIGSVQSVTNETGGVVAPGDNGVGTLTVKGDYIGKGGTVEIATGIGADNSETSRLVIAGDSSGNSQLRLVSYGQSSQQIADDTKIIEVAGNPAGTFALAGDYTTEDGEAAVVSGVYAYEITATPDQPTEAPSPAASEPAASAAAANSVALTGDGGFYLRNTSANGEKRYNPSMPIYEGYARNMQALNQMPSLQQRVGNRYWTDNVLPSDDVKDGHATAGPDIAIDKYGVWGRIEGTHSKFAAGGSTADVTQDIGVFVMQAGIDALFHESESGRLIGSLTAQYGKASSDISSFSGDGTIDTDGWGLGGALTWYGNNGYYLDGQLQLTWYDSKLVSDTLEKSLADGNKGFGYGLSLEGGRRIEVNEHWSITPQAQLVWSSVDFDSFHDVAGVPVDLRNGDSLNARIGLAAEYHNAWHDENNRLTETKLYVAANLYQEFMNDYKIRAGGVDFKSENEKTWGGIGAGGTYAWADGKYALFGEGMVKTSFADFGDNYSLKGTLGFKVNW